MESQLENHLFPGIHPVPNLSEKLMCDAESRTGSADLSLTAFLRRLHI